MSNIILKVENLSKQYRLGLVGTGTMGDDLKRWWHNLRGKEDPFLKIGDVNNRATKGTSDYVWALKDINFEVQQGEVLGIIGKNGAGKSTLLKILSKITSPTTGSIKSKGRVASLLEVGTGFHGEMTGRENIFLNGAILGMTKKEITAKLDEIIEFSGCERYIDTPVKRYSSGMTVRLAFAVAAFLEPDILIIDEVLAVGDAEFQKKAIGKMQEISAGGGRTVLFVSHNMAAVKSLCTRGIVLENGGIVFDGGTDESIQFYLQSNSIADSSFFENLYSEKESDILEITMRDAKNERRSVFSFEEKIFLQIKFKVADKHVLTSAIGFRVKDNFERVIFSSENYLNKLITESGIFVINVEIPNAVLIPNSYIITLGFHIPNQEKIISLFDIVNFKIEETGSAFHKYSGVDFGCVLLNCKWNLLI